MQKVKRQAVFVVGLLLHALALSGCTTGGAIGSGGAVNDTPFSFGALSGKAATTNRPVASNGSGAAAIGLTGQITRLEFRDTTSNLDTTQILVSSKRDTGVQQIYSIGYKGGNATRVTSGADYNAYGRYAPNGSRIAVTRGPIGQIWTINPDGTSPTQLTLLGSNIAPVWSPNGTRIAFTSDREAGVQKIYTMTSAGLAQTRLVDPPAGFVDSWPNYLPDGNTLLFQRSNAAGTSFDLYTVSSAGANLTRITNRGVDYNPALSPDGTRILTQRSLGGDFTLSEIWVMNVDGSNARQLTRLGVYSGNMAWSPDGTKITFASGDFPNLKPYVMNADGSGVQLLANIVIGNDNVSWSPFLQRRVLIGSGGLMGTTATGFIYGTTGELPASLVTFNNSDFTAVLLNSVMGLNTTGPVLVFDVEGATTQVAFTDMRYWNFDEPFPVTVSAPAGALIQISSQTGAVQLILPFTATTRSAGTQKPQAQLENGKVVYRGEFVGVWDSKGKNLAPNGAKLVETDPTNGTVLSLRQ